MKVADGAEAGAFLAHVAVADADAGGGDASIVDCAVNSTAFRLEPIGGGDYQLATAVVFGRGHDPVYVVAITCTDRGRPPLAATRSLSVLVVDAGPRFPTESISARLAPGAAAGTRLLRLDASGTDVGPEAEVRYSMSLVAGPADALAVDARSGWVTTTLRVGREAANSTFVYLATATDRGRPPLSAVTTLRVRVVDDRNHSLDARHPLSSTLEPSLMATDDGAARDDVGSDVIIASVVCATAIVLALIVVVAVAFCVRRRWCAGKDQSQSCCGSRHSSGTRSGRIFACDSSF